MNWAIELTHLSPIAPEKNNSIDYITYLGIYLSYVRCINLYYLTCYIPVYMDSYRLLVLWNTNGVFDLER